MAAFTTLPRSKRTYKPGSKGAIRQTRAAIRRAKRQANAQRSAGETGAMGYKATGGAPKTRFVAGAPTPIVVVTNPQNPQQGRIVAVGKRGGVYGRGGSPKGRWTDMETIKKITGNVLPVGLSIVAAGAGIQMLRSSKIGGELARRAPGGMNTVVFGAGAVTAYLAYRYRSFIIFMAGLGVGAYALMRWGTKESKFSLTMGDEDGDGIIDQDAIPPNPDQETAPAPSPVVTNPSPAPTPAPRTPPAFPNEAQAKAVAFNNEGLALFKQGAFGAASDKFLAAKNTLDDPAFGFNFARAKHKLAEFQVDRGNNIDARRNADAARLQYEIFISKVQEGRTSFVPGVDRAKLGDMANQARGFVQNIRDFLAATAGADQPREANLRVVQGVADDAAGMAGSDGYSELDDSGYPVNGMSGSVYVG